MFKSLFTSIFLMLSLTFSMGMTVNVSAQNNGINWMTWEEAMEKSKTEKRKIFVDVYTDWCGWCKKMDSTTFQDPVVANYINKNFYPVKFNAESKKTISFNNKDYKYVKSGKRGYHELAAWMTNGRLGYPTVVFISEEMKVIQPIPGYLPADKFEPIMTYFGGGHNKKTPWEIYQKKYSGVKTEGKALPASQK